MMILQISAELTEPVIIGTGLIGKTAYYIICAVLSLLVLLGISMLSKVETSVRGNFISAFALFAGVVLTLLYYEILDIWTIYVFLLIGTIIGAIIVQRVKMIQMPQMVALLNGVGGMASALVGTLSLLGIGTESDYITFSNTTATLAIVIGMITFVGSMVAAGKLHGVMAQKPVIWKRHELVTTSMIVGSLAVVVLTYFLGSGSFFTSPTFIIVAAVLFSSIFGYAFAIRVGGADMPITISLLNSLSGVAGSIAGMAIGDILLVAVGGIVGASGLLLTQIMCRAMNRSILDILLGKTSSAGKPSAPKATPPTAAAPKASVKSGAKDDLGTILKSAKTAIIVPGYGMALAQAQHQVRQLADELETQGTKVKYGVHPVAGRMPGHMNVLLAEADVPYEQLYEMSVINDEFKDTDLVIVIGANDVVNPAARDAEGTPIYGMPVLNVDQAKHVIICNFDLKPGYAGVPNPLYTKESGVTMMLGDAKESLRKILAELSKKGGGKDEKGDAGMGQVLKSAKTAIIVPGYGMALAQAQHQVRQLADELETQGTKVKYGVHPVAGRMPGHMNVLLAEADVPYEQLYEMATINDEFKDTDIVIVIGANDVVNPAARDAEGTPIYGMPVLNVDHAKHVIICNFDLNPGYAGVPNPLYSRESGVTMMLGDAKESLRKILAELAKSDDTSSGGGASSGDGVGEQLRSAKTAIIVPGYGMALAQAQHQVRQLGNELEARGAIVKYGVHPVAGRMPGHMNVLLAEADVPYEQLYEMATINDEFKDTDIVIVIGANDVVNPAARDAEGTPIYGMPVLNVDHAKHVIICNFDLNPGYAGVPNPLYSRESGVTMMLGDAKESLRKLLDTLK